MRIGFPTFPFPYLKGIVTLNIDSFRSKWTLYDIEQVDSPKSVD